MYTDWHECVFGVLVFQSEQFLRPSQGLRFARVISWIVRLFDKSDPRNNTRAVVRGEEYGSKSFQRELNCDEGRPRRAAPTDMRREGVMKRVLYH